MERGVVIAASRYPRKTAVVDLVCLAPVPAEIAQRRYQVPVTHLSRIARQARLALLAVYLCRSGS